ncbi:hypothetical protein [Lactococcus sp. SK2-659]|uniref:hypothetical protein n=1 Tax=Lactococcus sp. SK2-659 TaxID=2879150 RepID=UPI001CDBA00F|nr:hypothetical protein [Lactococcus sp. SK2-659]MCA2380613.1 hypothetical protein [Lactococcus sp. SK2-659]
MKNENLKNVKWIILVLLVILIPLVIFKSCQSLVKSQNEKKNKKDSIHFLYGAWISDVRLPMSKELKVQFYRANLDNEPHFKYGKEQVELIFRELKNGRGNIDGEFVRENSVYRPLNELDKDGFRPVKININERGEEAFSVIKLLIKIK